MGKLQQKQHFVAFFCIGHHCVTQFVVLSLNSLFKPFWAVTREYHGFRNPQGSRVGYAGVRVRVAKFVPSQNPYPQDAGSGIGGFPTGFPNIVCTKKYERKKTLSCIICIYYNLQMH